VLVLPSTTSTRFSEHVRGDDEVLEIVLPADSENYPVLNLVTWSFEERPYPIGKFSMYAKPGGEGPEILIAQFAITQSGERLVDLSPGHEPYGDKDTEFIFRLSGYGGMKEFAVQLQ
jgi:hypothetical protein